jgi:hypothetical protein
MLAYGISTDLVYDHLAIGESQAIECVKRFAIGIVNMFGEEYLRAPMLKTRLGLWGSTKIGGFQFPDMLGSIDCMHWSWKSYLAAWHG